MKLDIMLICDKCGREQEASPEESTESADVYPCVPCACGGKYKPVPVETIDARYN
jgi:hypothetical protein